MADFDFSYTHPVQQFIYAVEEGRCDYAAELCNVSGYGYGPEGFLHLLHKRHDVINEKYRLTTNGGESIFQFLLEGPGLPSHSLAYILREYALTASMNYSWVHKYPELIHISAEVAIINSYVFDMTCDYGEVVSGELYFPLPGTGRYLEVIAYKIRLGNNWGVPEYVSTILLREIAARKKKRA
jgi:hypothetical protein